MRKIFFIFIIMLNTNSINALESKIIYKIDNEIITNIDIKNEFKYLLALNSNLKKLNKIQIFEISKQSVIKNRIKKIEISKNFNKIKVNEDYVNKVIKNIYTNLSINSLESFKLYLEGYNLNLANVKNKITLEALWNRLVFNKYGAKIVINEQKIKDKIDKFNKDKFKEYSLSEIIYEIKSKEEINIKYIEIKKSIEQVGFENSASIYSFADSSKVGGNIGWISEKSFNKKIKENISNLKKGDISKPIILPNGVLLLKINEIRDIKNKINKEEELKKAINYEKEKQLNQYSKIYFNKVKMSLKINE